MRVCVCEFMTLACRFFSYGGGYVLSPFVSLW